MLQTIAESCKELHSGENTHTSFKTAFSFLIKLFISIHSLASIADIIVQAN